jgi:hypothetical protein
MTGRNVRERPAGAVGGLTISLRGKDRYVDVRCGGQTMRIWGWISVEHDCIKLNFQGGPEFEIKRETSA